MNNQYQTEGRWEKTKGQIRQEWAKLTDDEVELARGNREELIGRIKEKYGDTKETISTKLDNILAKLH